MFEDITKIGSFIEYLSLTLVYIFLLTLLSIITFFYFSYYVHITIAGIIMVLMMTIGLYLIYDDIKKREAAKQAITKKLLALENESR